jgi:hypothetical protein
MALMVLPIFKGPRMLACNVRRMVLVPTFEHLRIYLDPCSSDTFIPAPVGLPGSVCPQGVDINQDIGP